jgi:4-oxalocrotonate tautomerase
MAETGEAARRAAEHDDGRTRTPERTKEHGMPLIQVKLIEGVFSPEQKRAMCERLTDTLVSIEGESMRSVTWCVVEEVKSGDWAIAGNTLTTADVHALQAGAVA